MSNHLIHVEQTMDTRMVELKLRNRPVKQAVIKPAPEAPANIIKRKKREESEEE